MNKLRVSLDNRELGPIILPEKTINQDKVEKQQSRVLEGGYGEHFSRNKRKLDTIIECEFEEEDKPVSGYVQYDPVI